MRCLFCHRKIALLRWLIDRQFCCFEHRKRYGTASARALRDRGELLGGYDEYSGPMHPEPKKAGTKFGTATAAVIGLIVGLSLWMIPSSPVPIPGPKLSYSLTQNPIGQTVRSLIPDSPKINLRQDFRFGMGDWVGDGSPSFQPGSFRPDSLRLWKPSIQLRDYQLEFQASIEKKAMGWAFRATDLTNFYGTKLTLSEKNGRAEIERFVMLDGKSMDRVRLPIPLMLKKDLPYRVRVRVKGEYFTTSVNGQMVDAWRDRRLRTGGVGFFTEKGENSAVRWVSLSEPESFFSRLFAMGFLIGPLDLFDILPPM
jgi:hypothetical protein